MDEVWEPCPWFERTHAVSNMGRIARLPKVKGGKSRILKAGGRRKDRNDYVRVTLLDGGRKKTTYVHILVAKAFVDGYADGLEVNHINGDKTDNRAENLEWVTHGENQRHARDVLGRFRDPRPDLRRLSSDDIRIIRQSSRTQMDLAGEYGVSQAAICKIKNERTYRDVR